jgi:hypothetical protein
MNRGGDAMTVTLRGVDRGKSIELEQETGLPDGQAVSVSIRSSKEPGEGLRRAFGRWSDDPVGLDTYIEQVRRDRKQDRQEPAA